MRVLLDESLPRQLAREITGHDVRTVVQQAWAGLSNGELLRQASAAGFDVFITGDQNLQYQQNLTQITVGIIVVAARSNRIEDLLPLVPKLMDAISIVHPGEVIQIDA